MRSAWSRFIISLLMRMPDDIDALRASWNWRFKLTSEEDEAKYAAVREPDDPPTMTEYLASRSEAEVERSLFQAYMPLIDNQNIGSTINGMEWLIARTHEAKYEFLSSDRPIVRTPLGAANAHIALPIGPRTLFVAAKDGATVRQIQSIKLTDLVLSINSQVVSHANLYAYGSDDRQLRFVQNRMSREPQKAILRGEAIDRILGSKS